MPNLHTQQRDLVAWTELAEVDVLDQDTIAARHFSKCRSLRACQRRTKLWVDQEIVERMQVPVVSCEGRKGKLSTLFRLTRRGAELLKTLTGYCPRRPAKRNPRPETLFHRLGVAQVQLAVNDACMLQGLTKPVWIHEYDTYPNPDPKASADQRYILYERFPLADGRAATCWPDASCHIVIPGPDGTAHDLLVYWEYDRSTERLGQVAAKLFGFQGLLSTGLYRKHWPAAPTPTVRIFFVVPSATRLQNVAKVLADSPGSEAVRLTTAAELKPEFVLTEPIWRTVKGESLPILRNPMPRPS